MKRAMLFTLLLSVASWACGSKAPAPAPVVETPPVVDDTPTLDKLPAITADGGNVVVAIGATLVVKDRKDATAHEHAFADATEANARLAEVHGERDLQPLAAVVSGGSFDIRFNDGRVIVMSGGSPVHDKTYRAWTKPPAETCTGNASVDATWADQTRKLALLRITFEPADACTQYHVVAW
jgi:hypothetical protein